MSGNNNNNNKVISPDDVNQIQYILILLRERERGERVRVSERMT